MVADRLSARPEEKDYRNCEEAWVSKEQDSEVSNMPKKLSNKPPSGGLRNKSKRRMERVRPPANHKKGPRRGYRQQLAVTGQLSAQQTARAVGKKAETPKRRVKTKK